MDAGATSRSPRLTDMVTVRAPAGLGDQIRAAARAEGLRPGALIREAVSERIARAGVTVMTPDDRATVVAVGGEGLARNIERNAVDAEYRDWAGRAIKAARFRHVDHLLAAHTHLGAYIKNQADRPLDGTEAPEAITEGLFHLRSAYSEMDAAHQIEEDLGRLSIDGEA